jgi:hypothetical protein
VAAADEEQSGGLGDEIAEEAGFERDVEHRPGVDIHDIEQLVRFLK